MIACLVAGCHGSTFRDCQSTSECVGDASTTGGSFAPGSGGAASPGGKRQDVPSIQGGAGGKAGENAAGAGAGGCDATAELCGDSGAGGNGAQVGAAGSGGDRGEGQDFFSLGWKYRRPVEVANNFKARSDYVVLVQATMPWDQVEPDARDLRVTAADGTTPLPFHLERTSVADGMVTVHAWVKLEHIEVGSRREMFLYTGNPSASAMSDGHSVFAVYEGFENYPVGQVPAGTGYESEIGTVLSWTATQGLTLTPEPTWLGSRSLQIVDVDGASQSMRATFTSFSGEQRGVVSVWVRRGVDQQETTDDLDLWVHGDGATEDLARKAGVGLGGDGKFHYWGERPSPRTVPLDAQWTANTWYLLAIYYNIVTDAFVFTAHDSEMNEIVNASNMLLGNPAAYVDRATLTTSGTYSDQFGTFADELRVRRFQGPEPTTNVGAVEQRQ
jgi:hypothetical protein